ncbi:MAG: ferric reductase-like transmembrane domain-containing protein [Anaerolineaceae bacterium]|nr:ferric reductase-like transmembrane domain-containing protein [Anaerolineaceae bacterium]
MESNNSQSINIDDVEPSVNLGGFAFIMLAAFLGAMTAAFFLPNWQPSLTQSVSGADPKAFWYLSRGSAFSAYFLLWFSMLLGTGITNKLSVLWPGLPPTIELHQFTSIIGLAFGLFHGMILLGDHYINFSLAQVLLPFATSGYKPVAVGLGQVGFYTMLIITISFYMRKKIGPKTWRSIHFVSFVTYILVLIHGLLAGTDTSAIGAQLFYLITGGLLFFMILYRILVSIANAREKKMKLQAIPPKPPTS